MKNYELYEFKIFSQIVLSLYMLLITVVTYLDSSCRKGVFGCGIPTSKLGSVYTVYIYIIFFLFFSTTYINSSIHSYKVFYSIIIIVIIFVIQ